LDRVVTPGEYSDLLDARLPGLVVGAHLYGSHVLDDVVSDSDLDIVIELSSAAEVPPMDGPTSRSCSPVRWRSRFPT
jgi:hypothetical protein